MINNIDAKYDIHVHVVGDGSSGSGCWMRLTPWQRLLSKVMLSNIDLPSNALKTNFDVLYADRLIKWVEESSLDYFVILAEDQAYDENGKVIQGATSFYVPNDYIFELSKRCPKLLPGISIHPARPDALDELERCLEKGAVLLKILPNSKNIDCKSKQYKRFWERMAEVRLPLLAHTGGEHTVPIIRKDLSTPQILEYPLQCGVTVIAAHSGTKSGIFDEDFFPLFVEMLNRYPNFYGDISAFNIPLRSKYIKGTVCEEISSRLLHGSDFPVPIQGLWPWLRGLIESDAYKTIQSVHNSLERDYIIKKAVGYPEAVFLRAKNILRLHQLPI
ncbi:MAG: amidohydrolase family protein [bacterium]